MHNSDWKMRIGTVAKLESSSTSYIHPYTQVKGVGQIPTLELLVKLTPIRFFAPRQAYQNIICRIDEVPTNIRAHYKPSTDLQLWGGMGNQAIEKVYASTVDSML
jgi:hypothetical protein